MTLETTIRDLLEQEADRRAKATVHELADEAAQGLDSALCSWIGPTAASRWWRRWTMDQCGRVTPADSVRGDSVFAQHGGGTP